MPAPTNTSALTAISMNALPYSTTQDTAFGGTTYTVWYSYDATVDGTLRVFPFGYLDASSCQVTTVYRPFSRTFTGPAAAPVAYILPESWNTTLFVPVYSGTTYYFSFAPDAAASPHTDPTPAVLTLQADFFTETSPIPDGSFFIPADTNGFPAAIVADTTGTVLKLMNGFPAGEGGAQLADGMMLVEDESQVLSQQTRVILYDSAFNQIAIVNWDTSADGWYESFIGSNKSNLFYVGYNSDYVNFSGNSSFRTISTAGVGSGWTELPVPGLRGLAPSNDETILYYTHHDGANKQIKRWDLIGGAGLSDLAGNYTQGGNDYTPTDILVLDDGSIIIVYEYSDGTYNDVYLVQYNSSGTILHEYHRGNDAVRPSVRINYNYADPTTFIAYEHDIRTTGPADCQGRPAGTVAIKTLSGADLSTLNTTPAVWTSAGRYIGPQAAAVSAFGPSGSCPIFRLLSEIITPVPVITDISAMDCHRPFVQRLTITGTGFADGLSITGTDPLGAALSDLTVDSNTSTTINIHFSSDQYGKFCFVVQNPSTYTSSEFCITSNSCTEPVTMRRLRRASHISNENKWTFYSQFNLDYEAGVGLTSGQGDDPQLLLRWSDDGGHIWSDWHAIQIGKLGQYKHRAIWRRLGRGRKRLFELVCSDPVKLVLLDAFLELEQGTS